MHSQKHPCVRGAHTCRFVYLQAPCVHTYTHTHAQVTHAMLIHVCVHTSTHVQSHILCAHTQEFAHFICVHTSIQHTGVPFHMCTHTFHMCVPAHVCTPTHAHVPVASLTLPAAGRLYLWCPSAGSSSRRRAGFHLASSASTGALLSLPAVDLGLHHRPFSRLAALPPLSCALSSSSKT